MLYADATALSAGDGSLLNPWLALSSIDWDDVLADPDKAVTFSGDFVDERILVTASGTVDAPIRIIGNGTTAGTIDGTGGTYGEGIHSALNDYIRVEGGSYFNIDDGADGSGIDLGTGIGLDVSGATAYDCRLEGIRCSSNKNGIIGS